MHVYLKIRDSKPRVNIKHFFRKYFADIRKRFLINFALMHDICKSQYDKMFNKGGFQPAFKTCKEIKMT